MNPVKLQVYDPPMCCSSGVCGTSVNPELPRFANDLKWLQQRGVLVERFGLSSHPAAFMSQDTVKNTLREDGNDCLPLIVVNNLIASKGSYPTRNQLMEFVGLYGDNKGEIMEKSSSSIPVKPESPAVCGPGCNCGTSSSISKQSKIVVCIIVLLLIVGIFIYKASGTKQNISSDSTKEASFAVTQSAPKSMPANNSDVSGIMPGKKVETVAVTAAVAPEKKADVIAVTETKPAVPVADTIQISRKIGESLDSLSSLNKVALSQDTVFVFIPAAKNEFADDATKNAVVAAQRDLKSKNINIGLYTLPSSSPDYAALSAQVQAPAILVATKGKGMAVVSGEVTETKLLQAYVSSTRGGGCGPSSGGCGPSSGGCGPSSSGCN